MKGMVRPSRFPSEGVRLVLGDAARRDLAETLTMLMSDLVALYVKSEGYRRHSAGPDCNDHAEILAAQGREMLSSVMVIGVRVRKCGGKTLRSVHQIREQQRVEDDDELPLADPISMLRGLRADQVEVALSIREAHELCSGYRDVGTAKTLESMLDQADARVRFLSETLHAGR